MVEKLHVDDCEINDLYSIDSSSLATLDPIHGVIFLFKYGDVDRLNRDDPLHGEYDYDYALKGVFFAQQTIHNACATIAVLNILLNSDIDIGPKLSSFKDFVLSFPPDLVGEAISNCDLIRIIHNSFSPPASLVIDDKKRRDPPVNHDQDGVFHFVGYVCKNGRIYELDGLKAAPIDHGECTDSKNFYDKLPQVIQLRIALYGANELRFSLLAVTNNKLQQYTAQKDYQRVDTEMRKRQLWERENELRRHDYTGLVVKLLKNISNDLDDNEWKMTLDKARQAGQARLLRQYSRSQAYKWASVRETQKVLDPAHLFSVSKAS